MDYARSVERKTNDVRSCLEQCEELLDELLLFAFDKHSLPIRSNLEKAIERCQDELKELWAVITTVPSSYDGPTGLVQYDLFEKELRRLARRVGYVTALRSAASHWADLASRYEELYGEK